MKRVAHLALCCAIGCTSSLALAAPKRPAPSARAQEAKRLKDQGDTKMDQYAYPEAYELYQQAYAVEADPALVYNLARALQGMGDYPQALSRLEQFEKEAPPAVKAKVPLLGELMAEVRAHVSTLVVRSNVQGARIMLRDRRVGTVGDGQSFRVVAGAGVIEITADGYEPYKRTVSLPGNGTLSLDAKLVPRKITARLVVRVAPSGGMIEMDRVALGPAPLDAQVAPGTHALTIRHRGYAELRTSVSVVAGETRKLEVKLERKLLSQWWFWTGAAVLVAGGTALTVALLSERSADVGTFSPGQVQAPFRF